MTLQISDLTRKKLKASGLSGNQIRVCELFLIRGSNSLVAKSLFISEASLKYHMTKIYKKLGIDGKHSLLLYLFSEILSETAQSEIQKLNRHAEVYLPTGIL